MNRYTTQELFLDEYEIPEPLNQLSGGRKKMLLLNEVNACAIL